MVEPRGGAGGEGGDPPPSYTDPQAARRSEAIRAARFTEPLLTLSPAESARAQNHPSPELAVSERDERALSRRFRRTGEIFSFRQPLPSGFRRHSLGVSPVASLKARLNGRRDVNPRS